VAYGCSLQPHTRPEHDRRYASALALQARGRSRLRFNHQPDRSRSEATSGGCRDIDDLLEYIVADRVPQQTFSRVRVRLARDRKSLQLDLPGIEQLLPHLPALEDWLTSSLSCLR
jgi:hypothetical protein